MARPLTRPGLAIVAPLLFAVGCPAMLHDGFANDGQGERDADGGDAAPASPDAASASGGASTGAGGVTSAPDASGSGGAPLATGGGAGFDGGAGPTDGADGAVCEPCGTLAPCCVPRWRPIATPNASFVPREKAAYVAFGTKVFVWGGADATGTELRTGAIYDALDDAWSDVVVDSATPSARVLATAVWTGARLVVWGGGDAASLTDHATGAVYDPVGESWKAMTTSGAPSARRAPYAAWTGSRVLFWGGQSAAKQPVGGAYLYDPVGDAWTAASTTNEPPAPLNPVVGWTGSALLVYGGRAGGTSFTGRTDGLDASLDEWTRGAAGPQARQSAFGVWDGAVLVAWGGVASLVKGDGQRYVPSTNRWTNMISADAPTPRYAPHRETGWTCRIGDTTTLVLGGYDKTQAPLDDGGIYDSTANKWSHVEAWPSHKAHLWGVGVWAGSRFVLWGGREAALGALTSAGERFVP